MATKKTKSVVQKIGDAIDGVIHPHAHDEENATDVESDEDSSDETSQDQGPAIATEHDQSAILDHKKFDKFKTKETK